MLATVHAPWLQCETEGLHLLQLHFSHYSLLERLLACRDLLETKRNSLIVSWGISVLRYGGLDAIRAILHL